ncbi:3648_t:CDS:2, partial [Cetraspora pellucida]
ELSDDELEQDDEECGFDVAFSIVPCIHAIYYRTLHMSGNPLMSLQLTDPYDIQRRASHTRSSLLQYIAAAFKNDYLVAEFVLLQLLSRIYNRRNGLTLGKLVLNISNVPSCPLVTNGCLSSSSNSGLIHSNVFTKRVSTVLSSLLPKYHDLPLTLSTFNELLFYPRDNDKLDSGILQVNQGTWFLIDETVMEEGKLDDIGVRNLQALNEILDNQKLKYAFPFNDFEFETDIGAIILSNARSFLPCDCIIPLIPNVEDTLMFDVQEEILAEFRIYLSTLRYAEYSIPESVSEHIQNEFVNQRKNASKIGQPLVTQTDLLLRMTLASYGTIHKLWMINESNAFNVNWNRDPIVLSEFFNIPVISMKNSTESMILTVQVLASADLNIQDFEQSKSESSRPRQFYYIKASEYFYSANLAQ